ncbi:unnamed protein product, partial [marine sediment metagenome]
MGIHGKPDWGLQLKKTVYTFDDLSELAVRLGSISQFDRRGDVIFQDSFEYGLGKWLLCGDKTGDEQILISKRSRSGGYCVKLTGGSEGSLYSAMYIHLAYPVLSKLGMECHFALEDDVDYLLFEMRLFT